MVLAFIALFCFGDCWRSWGMRVHMLALIAGLRHNDWRRSMLVFAFIAWFICGRWRPVFLAL